MKDIIIIRTKIKKSKKKKKNKRYQNKVEQLKDLMVKGEYKIK